MKKRKNSGLSNAATDPVSLKVLSWNVAGLSEDCTDIFLSQIDAHRLGCVVVVVARMFQKITPSELLGGLRCPEVIVISDPGIREWETQNIGRRLQCKPFRYDRLFPCGRVDSETENAGGHKRFTVSESFTHNGDRTGLDGDKHVDERRHRTRDFHLSSWSNPEDSLTQMDFIMTSRKLDMKQVQVLDSDWFKTDHRAVLAVLSLGPKIRYTMRNGANLRACRNADGLEELEHDGTFASGNGKVGNQGDVSDRIGAQITSVEREENTTVPRANRIELALSIKSGERGER